MKNRIEDFFSRGMKLSEVADLVNAHTAALNIIDELMWTNELKAGRELLARVHIRLGQAFSDELRRTS